MATKWAVEKSVSWEGPQGLQDKRRGRLYAPAEGGEHSGQAGSNVRKEAWCRVRDACRGYLVQLHQKLRGQLRQPHMPQKASKDGPPAVPWIMACPAEEGVEDLATRRVSTGCGRRSGGR